MLGKPPIGNSDLPLITRRSVEDYFRLEGEYVQLSGTGNGIGIATGPINLAVNVTGMTINRCIFIEAVHLSSSIYAQGQVALSYGPTASAGYNIMNVNLTPGGIPPIPFRQIIRPIDGLNAGYGGLAVRKLRNADGTDATVAATAAHLNIAYIGRMMYDDLNFDADKIILFVGDSVFNGTGRATKLEMYDWKIRTFYADAGQNVRGIMKALSGSTSVMHETLRKYGTFDFQKLDLLVYQPMINDAAQSVPAATYVANLNAMMAMKRARYPRAKMLVLGCHPLQNSGYEAAAVTLRAAASSAVLALADPNIKFCDLGVLGSGFSSVASNYAASDGVGQGIHPTAAGDGLIFGVISSFLSTNFPQL